MARAGKLLVETPPEVFSGMTDTIHIGNISEVDLRIPGRPGLVEVVGIEPGQITTQHLREEASLRNGELWPIQNETCSSWS